MEIGDTLEAQRRAKNPLQQSTRVGRWFFHLKDLASRTWRYGFRRSDPENSPLFVTDADLVRLAALVSILGDTDDPEARAFTTVLRDLFFMPGQCRRVQETMPRIPANREALLRIMASHAAYSKLVAEGRARSFLDRPRYRPKEIVRVMEAIESPGTYMQWVANVTEAWGWKGKLTPARVFSALYDRYLESPAALEDARAGTVDPETAEAIRRMFD